MIELGDLCENLIYHDSIGYTSGVGSALAFTSVHQLCTPNGVVRFVGTKLNWNILTERDFGEEIDYWNRRADR